MTSRASAFIILMLLSGAFWALLALLLFLPVKPWFLPTLREAGEMTLLGILRGGV